MVAPPEHFGDYDTRGLRGAVVKLPAELRPGGAAAVGRDEIRALLQKLVHDRPSILISSRARWVLNAFAAGYAREVDKRGRLSDEARPGIYRVLVEGLESLAGLMRVGMVEAPVNLRFTEGGQRYVSALPSRQPSVPAKDSVLHPDIVSDFGLTAR